MSWMLVLVAGGASVKPGEDFAEPLGMIFGPIAYTITYNDGRRKTAFKAGLIFSVILSALSGVWAVIAYLITVYTGRKLD